MTSQEISKIISHLEKEYPEVRCSLNFSSPFQLLVATILSAQCTDERVNRVTPELFKKYPDSFSMAMAPLKSIETLIRSTGFYHHKAKALKEASEMIVKNHQGNVPQTMEELVKLRGVGRKTANVVLGNSFGIPGVVVDTHVGRLSRRMGLSRNTNPEKVERDLMGLIPKNQWTIFSHLLVFHGRKYCTARKPNCKECPIRAVCRKIGVKLTI